jgi:hypothetical protein
VGRTPRGWPYTVAAKLNEILPPEYRSGPKVDLKTSEYASLIHNTRRGRTLVAAIEFVSPSNKDRPESRRSFVAKCHAMLSQCVSVVIVDVVTSYTSNLYAELAKNLGAVAPKIANADIYAVSLRRRERRDRIRVESWEHRLNLGDPLPTLPLFVSETLSFPLELESSYEATCRGLRIG